MTIKEMIKQLKGDKAIESTDDIKARIKRIKDICYNHYSNQSYYGNAALNRKMLLDAAIADELTPEVIQYLFAEKDIPDQNKILRNSTGLINLRDAIDYGFQEGLASLRLMPCNESVFSEELYEQQKRNYDENTSRIINSIITAYQNSSGNNLQLSDRQLDNELTTLYSADLMAQFEMIVSVIKDIREKNKSGDLCYVPGYGIDSMHRQVTFGFQRLLRALSLNETSSIQNICHAFLNTPAAMLNGDVIHQFYDRAHLESALDQTTKIQLGGKEYSFEDIFREIINTYVANPARYSNVAKEQLHIRLFLVEQDLKSRFQEIYSSEVKRRENPISVTVSPSPTELPSGSGDQLTDKVNRMITSLQTLSTSINNEPLNNVLTALIAHSEAFLQNNNLSDYKKACGTTLAAHKNVLDDEKGAPRTIYQHIKAAFRALFNLLDVCISMRTGETMAETYNPVARLFTGRNHFLSAPPEPTPFAKAIQAFTEALKTLDNDADHVIGPQVP